ncbi:MAG TPA: flagellar hook-basal body complex protein FliE [Deltaproteobacteria bacterium]|nr:flagellar hook-basal body complex protein FliE [Deltaproteobacteria bacterium]HPR54068.1 flagellar hook-basal body complex protein FliE [Deltaproteobacteria bacterium]HXK46848.1 flagellar hook-basal body complex protein FliE [Deltaproteobacteria bacterium]
MRIDMPGFTLTNPLGPDGKKDKATGLNFVDTLKDAIDSTNKLVKESEQAASDLSSGTAPNIHEAMIAMQKADITLRLMVTMTNKLIEGFNELKRLS